MKKRIGSYVLALLSALMGSAQHSALAQQSGGAPVSVDRLPMPPFTDYSRAALLDKAESVKVYVAAVKLSETQATRPVVPNLLKEHSKLSRLLTDTVLESRRFEVLDLRSSTVLDQTNYLIDAEIVDFRQDFRPIENGATSVESVVYLSIQMKDQATKANVFPTAVKIEGRAGRTSGDRIILNKTQSRDDPSVRQALLNHYETALRRAFELAAERIESVLRPQVRVLVVEGRDVGVFGGFKHGLQQGDELIVFRAKIVELGDTKQFGLQKPVAKIICNGVGNQSSQCEVTELVVNESIQAGDYAILTDQSLQKVRFK